MRVVDGDGKELPTGQVGELAIRGHNVMKGYWGKPDATAEAIPDGWFRTGDLATVDDDGYFFIVGRQKDLIIRGATTSTRARSRTPCTSIKPSPRSPSSASRIPSWARRSAPPWCSSREQRPPPRNCGLSPENGWRPTSIPAMSGSSAPCPRALPARSCTAKCSRRKTSCRDRSLP